MGKKDSTTTKAERKFMKFMAKNFKAYLKLIDEMIIIDGLSKEEYLKARKKVKKLIKHLKKGDKEECFDLHAYNRAITEGRINLEEFE